jgi:hypothetical protein
LKGPSVSKVCDQTEKAHVVAFRERVLAHYGGADLGILRPCDVGGPSLHHQGLAWDWALDASNPVDQERVARLVADLGTYSWDEAGLALLIWDKRTYKPSRGWRAYDGFGDDGKCTKPPCRDPHTGHVHFSFAPTGGALSPPPSLPPPSERPAVPGSLHKRREGRSAAVAGLLGCALGVVAAVTVARASEGRRHG